MARMRMGRARLTLAAVLLAVAGVSEAADDWGGWRDRVTLTLSDRLRGELVDWFRPRGAPRGAGRYGFFASRLRAGVSVTLPHVQLVLQGQDTRLANLPGDAVFPPPVGPLGPGALYVLHTHETTQGEPFLKLGFVTLRRSGLSLTGGRFEYADGLETEPANPTLAFLKRYRLAERLVGPFSYSHVSRSFDGGRVSYDRPDWNLSAMASRPTHSPGASSRPESGAPSSTRRGPTRSRRATSSRVSRGPRGSAPATTAPPGTTIRPTGGTRASSRCSRRRASTPRLHSST